MPKILKRPFGPLDIVILLGAFVNLVVISMLFGYYLIGG